MVRQGRARARAQPTHPPTDPTIGAYPTTRPITSEHEPAMLLATACGHTLTSTAACAPHAATPWEADGESDGHGSGWTRSNERDTQVRLRARGRGAARLKRSLQMFAVAEVRQYYGGRNVVIPSTSEE